MSPRVFAVSLIAVFSASLLLAPPTSASSSSPATTVTAVSQAPDTTGVQGALSVFVDCKTRRCDFDYFRRQITFVNYVRNRQDADVHVLITTQRAGSGGVAFSLEYIGQKRFDGSDHTLDYTSSQTDTDDEQRQGLTRTLKAGLVRYVAQTPAFEYLSIDYDAPEDETQLQQSTEDPWNFWVFEVGAGGSFSGEQQTSSKSVRGSLEANRTTEDWKFDLETSGRYRERTFEVNDSTTVTDIQRNARFESLMVRSISQHWSIGGFGEARRSTFNNYDLALDLSPALEYNIFPYAQSTQRQLTVLYRTSLRTFDYRNETIFNKTSETLFQQSLRLSLEVEQPWGSVNTSVEGSHYLHDFSKKRLEMFGNFELNLYRGLSLDMFGRFSLIRDQLNLEKGDADPDDILLERRQLATDFEYFVSIGLSYTFGSTTNNIVNPRFDG